MLEGLVALAVLVAELYLLAGLVFAVAFVTRGVERVDPAAARGTWGFRLAILPGCAALWPLLARRWLRGEQAPEERNDHRELAAELAEPGSAGGDAP